MALSETDPFAALGAVEDDPFSSIGAVPEADYAKQLADNPDFNPYLYAYEHPEESELAKKVFILQKEKPMTTGRAIGLIPKAVGAVGGMATDFVQGAANVAMNVPIAAGIGLGSDETNRERAKTELLTGLQTGEANAGHFIESLFGKDSWIGHKSPEQGGDTDQERWGKEFEHGLEHYKKTQSLAQGIPSDQGLVAGFVEGAGQLGNKLTAGPNGISTKPSEIFLSGPEIEKTYGAGTGTSPEVIGSIGAITDPSIAAPFHIPGATKAAGGVLKVAGEAAQLPARAVSMLPSKAARIAKYGLASAVTGGTVAGLATHPEETLTGLAGAAALAGGVAGARVIGKLAANAGDRMLNPAFISDIEKSAAKESIAGKKSFITQNKADLDRTFSGVVGGATGAAAGMAPIAAATADSPEQAAEMIGGAAGLGGLAGLPHNPLGFNPQTIRAVDHVLRENGRRGYGTDLDEAHNEFTKNLSEADRNAVDAYRGFFQGFRLSSGGEPQIYVLPKEKFAEEIVKHRPDMTPELAAQQSGFKTKDGKILINGESSDTIGGRMSGTLGHESGHIAEHILRTLAPEMANAMREGAEKGLIKDGKPTEQLKQFVDAYNKQFDPTGERKEIDTHEKAITEWLAEQAQAVLSGEGPAKYAAGESVRARIADNLGDYFKQLFGTKDRFDRSTLPDVADQYRQLLFELGRFRGQEPPAETAPPVADTATNPEITRPAEPAVAPVANAAVNQQARFKVLGIDEGEVERVRGEAINQAIDAAREARGRGKISDKALDAAAKEAEAEFDQQLEKYASALESEGVPHPDGLSLSEAVKLNELAESEGGLPRWRNWGERQPAPVDEGSPERIVEEPIPGAESYPYKADEVEREGLKARGWTDREIDAMPESQVLREMEKPLPEKPLEVIRPSVAQKPAGELSAVNPADLRPEPERPASVPPAQKRPVVTQTRINTALRRAEAASKPSGRAKARLDALRALLPEGDVIIDRQDPVHAAILRELKYSGPHIDNLMALQKNIGKGIVIKDYLAGEQEGFESGGAEYSGEKRNAEYEASPTGEAGKRQGAITKQDKGFTPYRVTITNKGVNVLGFDHDKFLDNMRKVLDVTDGTELNHGFEGMKGAELDKAIGKAFSQVAENHRNGYAGNGQKLPAELGIPVTEGYKPHPVPQAQADAINMAMHNRGKAEKNPLRSALEASGFEVDRQLKPTISNIRPDLIEGGIGTEHSGRSVHASGLDIEPSAFTEKGIPLSKPTQEGFQPSTGDLGDVKPSKDPSRLWAEKGVNSPFFKKWAGKAKVYRLGDDLMDIPSGKPVVIEGVHGTTRNFTEVDINKTNPDNDWGRGFYVSNTPEDVAANYAGIGPDLSGRLEQIGERMASDIERMSFEDAHTEYGVSRSEYDLLAGDVPRYSTPEYKQREELIISLAKKQATEHEGATMKVFVKLENPLELGNKEEFWDMNYPEEGGDPSGKLVDFMEAFRNEASLYDGEIDEGWVDALYDGARSGEVIRAARAAAQEAGLTDPETGDLVSNEVVRAAIERMGYDGIIDKEVDAKFGSQRRVGQSMKGMNPDTVHIIAFDKAQIKSATGNQGTFNPKDPRISFQPSTGKDLEEIEPSRKSKVGKGGFYSQLEKVVNQKIKGRVTPDQLRATLKNNGVKTEEIDWTLGDLLSGDRKSITPQELQDAIAANRVELKEVVKGGGNEEAEVEAWWNDEGGANEETPWSELTDSEKTDAIDRYRDEVGSWSPENSDVTKFSQYQLPGGENYREILYTLPERYDRYRWQDLSVLGDKESNQYGETSHLFWFIKSPDNVYQIPKSKFNTSEKAIDYILENKKPLKASSENFKSSHFDEPNIILHTRVNDRTTSDGQSMLFAEELQSDLHQKGREKGYKGDTSKAEKRQAEIIEELDAIAKRAFPGKTIDRMDIAGILERNHSMGIETGIPAEEMESAARRARQLTTEAREEVAPAMGYDAVPNLPFKGEAWKRLGLKKTIELAVKEGKDRIGWTTGEQQAERYDLSKHVSKITAERMNDGRFQVEANNLSGQKVIEGIYRAEELPDVIGKELAEKIVSRPVIEESEANAAYEAYVRARDAASSGPGYGAEQERLAEEYEAAKKHKSEIVVASSPVQVFEGLDLKVGGEGMRGFYDKELVNLANDIGKRYGARVEKVEVVTGEKRGPDFEEYLDWATRTHKITETKAKELWTNEGTRSPIVKEFVDANQTKKINTEVWSLPITPKMREAVSGEGQSLFQPSTGDLGEIEPSRKSKVRESAQEEWNRLYRKDKDPEADIQRAYKDLVKRDGFSHVLISDLQKESGVALPELQDWLRKQSKEGGAFLATGDWSLSDKDARDAAIYLKSSSPMYKDGEPHLRVKLEQPSELGGFQPNSGDKSEELRDIQRKLDSAWYAKPRDEAQIERLRQQQSELLREQASNAPKKEPAQPRDREIVPASVGRPIPEGHKVVAHWSPREGLTEIDPSFHGKGKVGAERARKVAHPDRYVERAYVGYGDYRQESGTGNNRYTPDIDFNNLYDYNKDPLGLKSLAVKAAGEDQSGGRIVTEYERLIKEHGYLGYFSDPHNVAAIFHKIPADGSVGGKEFANSAPDYAKRSPEMMRALHEYVPNFDNIEGSYWEQRPADQEQVKKQNAIAKEYADAKVDNLSDPKVQRAYTALVEKVNDQYDTILKGIDVEPWAEKQEDGTWKSKEGQPYKSSAEMQEDMRGNKHLYFFITTSESFGTAKEGQKPFSETHPMFQQSGKTTQNGFPLMNNDILRAVHDAIAHGAFGLQFGPTGEEAAWRAHMATVNDPWARWALTTETRGQNSWVNYRDEFVNSDGSPKKKGDPGYVSPSDRPFADQKADLLDPKWMLTGDKEVDRVTEDFLKSYNEKETARKPLEDFGSGKNSGKHPHAKKG